MLKIISELKRLAYFYPKTTKLIRIGKSFEGKDLYAIEISTNSSKKKPLAILNCGIHGREWLAIGACIGLIRQMVFYSKSNDRISGILDNVDVYAVPLLNVDGYDYSRKEERMWRKSRTSSARSTCSGIDINRNFNYRWGGGGSSIDPCDDTYSGTHPFSTTEALSLARYLYRNRHRITIFLDVHTFGQLWMSPWGFSRHASRHKSLHRKVLRRVTESIERATGISYKSGPTAHMLYEISGDSVDWVYGFLGIVHSYGVELRPTLDRRSTNGFRMPPFEIQSSVKELTVGLHSLVEFVIDEGNAKSRR